MLLYMIRVIKENLASEWTLYSDISNMMSGCSTIPADIVVTKQKPNLVIVNRSNKTIIKIELSIPFELNIQDN